MTMKVRIWLHRLRLRRKLKRIGHASIQLSAGPYISHWPKGGKGLSPKVPGTPDRTLEQDVLEEGGDPDFIFEIPAWMNLDEDAIQTWWEVNKKEMYWSGISNCCWVVREALIIGGIGNHLKIQRVWINHPINLCVLMLLITNLQPSSSLQEQTETQEDWDNIIVMLAVIDSTLTVWLIYWYPSRKSEGDDSHCLWILKADGLRKSHFMLQVLVMITVSQIYPKNRQHSVANAESKDKSLNLKERNYCDFQIEPICDCCSFHCSVFNSPTQTNCTLQTNPVDNSYKPGTAPCSEDLASFMSLMGDNSQDFSILQIDKWKKGKYEIDNKQLIYICISRERKFKNKQYSTHKIFLSPTTSIHNHHSVPCISYPASIADNSQHIRSSQQNNQNNGDKAVFTLLFVLVLCLIRICVFVYRRSFKKNKKNNFEETFLHQLASHQAVSYE